MRNLKRGVQYTATTAGTVNSIVRGAQQSPMVRTKDDIIIINVKGEAAQLPRAFQNDEVSQQHFATGKHFST